LRRAMGKKKAEEMAKQREIFTEGAKARGVDPDQATHIFDLMEKFAGYGFNKSHSAAYALLSYQTAWLKAHYPSAFMAAVMSADIDNTDKLVTLKADCGAIGVTVLPPDINQSVYGFNPVTESAILYGLGALKGVGRNVIEAMVAEREAHGPFESLAQLCQRMGRQGVNRRAYEALIKAGALDSLDSNRRAVLAALPDALKSADQAAQAVAAGQDDMFGVAPPPPQQTNEPGSRQTEIACWTDMERLTAEKEALGLYLSGHPFGTVSEDAGYFTSASLGQLASTPEPSSPGGEKNYARRGIPVTVAGLVMDIRKRGNRVTFILDDNTAQMEVSLFAEAWLNFKHIVTKDSIVVVEGTVRYDDFIGGWRVAAKRVEAIDRVIEDRANKLVLSIRPNGHGEQLFYQLQEMLMPYREGQCGVLVNYTGATAKARLSMPESWSVRPCRELREQLEGLLGPQSVRLFYAQSH
ncbi:MAG: OB-fold nucleic acid binding domain-containing protein, partial [Pseudomonadota bacterium]